jgi:hypothetical protein
LSRRYHCRPSEFLHGDWRDYQFDSAVALYGAFFDEEYDQWRGEGKKRRRKHSPASILARLRRAARQELDQELEEEAPETRYAPLAALLAEGVVKIE